MFTITTKDETWGNLTHSEIKLKEAFYRGLEISYTITYPDGHKIICTIER